MTELPPPPRLAATAGVGQARPRLHPRRRDREVITDPQDPYTKELLAAVANPTALGAEVA
jgi:hypothetical protein